MKKYFSIIIGIVALAMVTTVSAQNTEDGLVKVVSLKGAARFMAVAGAEWKPIKVGLMLKPGAVIQTAADSYVDLVLNNAKATQGLSSSVAGEPTSMAASSGGGGSDSGYKPKAVQDAIRIFENTVLSVDKLTVTKTGADTVTDTQLNLKAGRIFGTVKKLSAASTYEITLPNGVAGIRGTIYLIGAEGTVTVLTGSVVVSYVSNGTVVTKEVPAGYQFNPSSGQVSEAPKPVLLNLGILAKELNKSFLKVATSYTKDNTVYNVSPTRNQNGQGQNNNNQGGNNQ